MYFSLMKEFRFGRTPMVIYTLHGLNGDSIMSLPIIVIYIYSQCIFMVSLVIPDFSQYYIYKYFEITVAHYMRLYTMRL